jgi:hypothetical protein
LIVCTLRATSQKRRSAGRMKERINRKGGTV